MNLSKYLSRCSIPDPCIDYCIDCVAQTDSGRLNRVTRSLCT